LRGGRTDIMGVDEPEGEVEFRPHEQDPAYGCA